MSEASDNFSFARPLVEKWVSEYAQENPDTDIQSAFFNAGYRSRTTAWRNFKDIMGVSPADYRASLEQVSK